MSKSEDKYNLIHKVLMVIVFVCVILGFINLFAGWHSLFISIPCILFSFALIASSNRMRKRSKQKMQRLREMWSEETVYHMNLTEQGN